MSLSTEKNSTDEISLIDLFQSIYRFTIRIILKIRRHWVTHHRILMMAFVIGVGLAIVKTFFLDSMSYSTQAVVYSRYLRGSVFVESIEDLDKLLKTKNYEQLEKILGLSCDGTPLSSLIGVYADFLETPSQFKAMLDDDYYKLADGYFKVEFDLKDSVSVEDLVFIQKLLFQYVSSVGTLRQMYYMDSTSQFLQKERFKNEVRSIEQVRSTVVNQIAEGKISSSPLSISLADGASISNNLPIELHRESIRLYNEYLKKENYLSFMSPLNYVKPFGAISKAVRRESLLKQLSNNFAVSLLINALLLGIVLTVAVYFVIMLIGFNKWLAQQETSTKQP